MRGRPISTEEFERMLAEVPAVRPRSAGAWAFYLNGLWLSGLRIEESTVLSWNDGSPFSVELSGRHPHFQIYAEAVKGHRDQLQPIIPDFAEFLLHTPGDPRTGHVFKLHGAHTGTQMTSGRVGRIVPELGKKTNVVVNEAEGKYANVHRLQRSLGTCWAGRVRPATLQPLMRHESIETTLDYYVAQDADEVADELWREHGHGAQPGRGEPQDE